MIQLHFPNFADIACRIEAGGALIRACATNVSTLASGRRRLVEGMLADAGMLAAEPRPRQWTFVGSEEAVSYIAQVRRWQPGPVTMPARDHHLRDLEALHRTWFKPARDGGADHPEDRAVLVVALLLVTACPADLKERRWAFDHPDGHVEYFDEPAESRLGHDA